MDKKTGVVAVIIFLVILAFPFFYNLFSVGFSSKAAAAPKLTIPKPGQCVADTSWMRHNHMKMLLHVRDDSVREGIRLVDKSFHGCIDCHPKRDEFCNACHEYVGVQPECWHCHDYPL